jgi:protoporphyrinogen oxidase
MDSGRRQTARIGIVGGGPGGLFTAYRLQCWSDRPVEVVLLEASGRLGGKVQTERFDAAPVLYEVGAAELYDVSPVDEDPLRDLVRELGLPTTTMAGQAVELGGRLIANLDDLEGALGTPARTALERFDERARGRMAPRQFYDSDLAESFVDETERGRFARWIEQIDEPDARRYLETLIHSDLATEPDSTNLRYGLQNYLMNDGRYMQLYSIDGGNERLIEELVRRTRAEVRLETRAERIATLEDGRTRIDLEGGESLEVDHAVLALPQPQLAQLSYEGPELPGAMATHLAHHDHPADYLRVTVLFERPFWKHVLHESFLMLEAFGGCCLYDESSRMADPEHGVLGWLLAGDAARDMKSLSDDELVAAALGSLPPALAHGRELVLEARVHRWIGSVSALPGGRQPQPIELRHLPSPSDAPRLHLVGDYLYDSTLNGVLEGAEAVARCIASDLASR